VEQARAENGKINWYKQCDHCFRWFPNEICYDNHQKKMGKAQKSACETIWECAKCKNKYLWDLRKPETHVCGESRCQNCKQWQTDPDHPCYLQQKHIKAVSEKYGFLDFEAWTDRILPCTCMKACKSGLQHMNYVALEMFDGSTKAFGALNSVDEDVVDAFCRYIFKNEFRGYTFFAHNAKGYDAQPIAKWLIAHSITPEITPNGCKINQLKVTELNIRINDSLLHLKDSLKNLSKTFGLQEVKGDFPHLFNHPRNYEYIGKYPAPYYYGVDRMTTLEKQSVHYVV
jgi:hypothetical protein